MLLHSISCENLGDKFACNEMHSQFFSENLHSCSETSYLCLTELSNGQTIFTDELLDLCDISRSNAGQEPPSVVVFINWCSTGLELCMQHNYMYLTKTLLTNHFLNCCQGFWCSLSEIYTNIYANLLLLFFISILKITRRQVHGIEQMNVATLYICLALHHLACFNRFRCRVSVHTNFWSHLILLNKQTSKKPHPYQTKNIHETSWHKRKDKIMIIVTANHLKCLVHKYFSHNYEVIQEWKWKVLTGDLLSFCCNQNKFFFLNGSTVPLLKKISLKLGKVYLQGNAYWSILCTQMSVL